MQLYLLSVVFCIINAGAPAGSTADDQPPALPAAAPAPAAPAPVVRIPESNSVFTLLEKDWIMMRCKALLGYVDRMPARNEQPHAWQIRDILNEGIEGKFLPECPEGMTSEKYFEKVRQVARRHGRDN